MVDVQDTIFIVVFTSFIQSFNHFACVCVDSVFPPSSHFFLAFEGLRFFPFRRELERNPLYFGLKYSFQHWKVLEEKPNILPPFPMSPFFATSFFFPSFLKYNPMTSLMLYIRFELPQTFGRLVGALSYVQLDCLSSVKNKIIFF